MPQSVAQTVKTIIDAASWNDRVNLIRQIPEEYGRAQWRGVFAKLSEDLYVPQLTPDFAYVHWREGFELSKIEDAYQAAVRQTSHFTKVSVADLQACLIAEPKSLLIFRLFLGYLPQELAAATTSVANALKSQAEVRQDLAEDPQPHDSLDLKAEPLTKGRIKSIEAGNAQPKTKSLIRARVLAVTITRGMEGTLFPDSPDGLRSKQDRPDLAEGWGSVQAYAEGGVPFPIYLHQRHYGGAFRQLLDSTSGKRGDTIENAVEEAFKDAGIPFIRTGSSNQTEIAQRFNLTVRPAPDFVVYDSSNTLAAILECKGANDGGTARDKAARFRSLREEAQRLGGIPVFAVLGGLGWTRTSDALGPVVQACDGRVFTLSTLSEMLEVNPFPGLRSP